MLHERYDVAVLALSSGILQKEVQVFEGTERALDALAQLASARFTTCARERSTHARVQERAHASDRLFQGCLALRLPGRPALFQRGV